MSKRSLESSIQKNVHPNKDANDFASHNNTTGSNPSSGDDENNIISVSILSFFTTYIPTFVTKYQAYDLFPPEDFKKQFSDENWITPSLNNEIEQCLPKKENIINANGLNTRSSEAFQESTKLLFPKGRVFAGHRQLHQTAELFCNAWAVAIIHSGNCIGCHYGEPVHKKPRLHVDESKRRKCQHSMKTVVKCPFKISYSRLSYPKHKDLCLPKVYYQIKITLTNFIHTCQLNTLALRQAKQ